MFLLPKLVGRSAGNLREGVDDPGPCGETDAFAPSPPAAPWARVVASSWEEVPLVRSRERNGGVSRFDISFLPPEEPGTEYRFAAYPDPASRLPQQYVTTGLFPVDAPDRTKKHLYRAGELAFDVDVKDAVCQSEGITNGEAKARTNAMSEVELGQRVDALLQEFAAAWVQLQADNPDVNIPLPTAVMRSGGGIQIHLHLKDGEGYKDEVDLVQAVNREFAKRLNDIAGREMVDLATTDTGTRILRPPGTMHSKNARRQILVVLDGKVYTENQVSVRTLAKVWGIDPSRYPKSAPVIEIPVAVSTLKSAPVIEIPVAVPTTSVGSSSSEGGKLLVPDPKIWTEGKDVDAIFGQLFESRMPELREMVAADPLFRWAVANPNDVGREAWRALAQNLIAACNNHFNDARVVFHEVSAGYNIPNGPSYSVEECDRYFDEAMDSVRASGGPMTFDYLIGEYGGPEGAWAEKVFGGNRPLPGTAPAGNLVRRKNARKREARAGIDPPPPLAPGEVPPPDRPYGPFERGDDVELGQDLAERLGRDVTVYDREELRQYRIKIGGWRLRTKRWLERSVQPYAGRYIVGKDKNGDPSYKKIHLAHHQVKGIAETTRNVVIQERFFDDARQGTLFKNGFLNTDGVLEPFNPEHRAYAEHALPFDYDTSGVEPVKYIAFLNALFQGDDDAEQKIMFLQEWMGAMLLGCATDYGVAPFLLGHLAANGKSTFFESISPLVTKAARIAVPPQKLDNEYSLIRLVHAKLNLVADCSERDIIESAAFKAVITGDEITGRQIRQEQVTFFPRAAHIFGLNQLPRTWDTTNGFWRRVMIITFNNRFLKSLKEPNPGKRSYPAIIKFSAQLKEELPQIAAWAIKGGMRLFENNGSYTEPRTHKVALDEWKGMSDVVLSFSSECMRRSSTKTILSSHLYEAFTRWCDRNGHTGKMSNKKFTQKLLGLDEPFELVKGPHGNMWPVEVFVDAPPPDAEPPPFRPVGGHLLGIDGGLKDKPEGGGDEGGKN